MNDILKECLEIQKEVDEIIKSKYDGEFKETLSKRIIAFKVEVSEFANEIGSFKYWKKSHVRNKERILDEGADCLAFLFSIINSYELGKKFCQRTKDYVPKTNHYLHKERYINYSIRYLLETEIEQKYLLLVWLYETIRLCVVMCGYTEEELIDQYKKKSLVNVERARGGY